MDKPGFWAVLPANVRYDPDLRPNAKLMYAEITALMGKSGCCFASNKYFMDVFEISDRTVTDLIRLLKEKGYIDVDVVNEGGTNRRRIVAGREVVLDDHPAENCGIPPQKIAGCPPAENCGMNNDNSLNNFTNPPLRPPKGTGVGKSTPKGTGVGKSTPKHSPERFEGLWEYYPHGKRGNRQRAIKAWDKLKPSDELIDTIARDLVARKKSEAWQAGIGISHVSTYFNNAGWLDDIDNGVEESTPDPGGGWAPDPDLR